MPRIEEVKRIIEVLQSIGVRVEWQESGDIVITPPEQFNLAKINRDAAVRTRSIAMFAAPLAHLLGTFELPAPTGCDLGKRTLGAHIDALEKLGIEITGNEGAHSYHECAPSLPVISIPSFSSA